MVRSDKNVLKKNCLKLCDWCRGTGINPNDRTENCPVCRGMKIINHFEVQFSVDVPYVCETDRHDNAYMILDHIKSIYQNLDY